MKSATSTYSYNDLFRHQTGLSRSLGTNPLKMVFETLKVWSRRSSERQHLSRLDNRLLRDIGMQRADVEFEINKPFWSE